MPSNTSFYSSSGVTNTQTDATGAADNDNPSKTSFYSDTGVKSKHTDAIEAAIANAENSAAESSASAISSEASRVAAQLSETNAETAETNTEIALTTTQIARDASIVAKDQSVVAKVASETAKTASETAKGLAETAAQNASASATAATTNGAIQVSLAADQVALATTQANLATTNGAAQVQLAADQVALATTGGAAQVALATTQVGLATTKANEAAASASSINATELTAQANALAASQSAAAAATALDQFDDRYLGSKSAEPTLDNDGNALVQGALYFSSSSASMQVYDGANWIAASSSGVASLNQFEYTATANQTAFTGTDDHGLAMSFISANILVTLNGIILDSSDYTATNGITITLDEVAAVGDLLNVYAFKSFQIADTVSASTGGTFNGQVTFGANATFNSNTTFGANATFSDNTKLRIGNSGDMEMYHNGVNSFISDFGQGKLIFTTNGASLDIYDNANGHTMAEFKNNAGVKLKHQGSTKIETTSTGVDISGNIRLEDNEKIYFGNSDDFQLYHDSNNSYIHETGTGNLIIRADQFDVKTSDASQYKIRAITNGGVSLYNAGAVKLTTNASGVTVSGALNATTLTGDGSALTGMFSGDYNSLSNKPSLFDGNYNSLSNRPSLFDGSYNSLSNRPTIPSNNNQLSNGAGYLTSSSILNSSRLTGSLPAISGANLTGMFSGSYNDLTNKPTTPTATLHCLAVGSGGGGGGYDGGSGGSGGSGALVHTQMDINVGDTLYIHVGYGGEGGMSGKNRYGGGLGGFSTYGRGGKGGFAGGNGTSGGGGGGGGASAITLNGIEVLVAGGGGGGGGSNEGVQNEQAAGGGGRQPRGNTWDHEGQEGFGYYGDGGGGGGGGGGWRGGLGQIQNVSQGASGGDIYIHPDGTSSASVYGYNGASNSPSKSTAAQWSGSSAFTYQNHMGQGGGGSNNASDGTDGDRGVVYVRYQGSQRATGGNSTFSSGGYTVHRFENSGHLIINT